jgi:hypothetical protein
MWALLQLTNMRILIFVLLAVLQQPMNLRIEGSIALTITVPSGSDLQAAINNAVGGTTLVLPNGSVFTGNFVLPMKTAGVTITSSAPPSAGTRVGPLGSYARLVSPNASPVIATQGPANGWSLIGLELAGDGGGDLVTLGDGSATQITLTAIPQDLHIDRCYLHGSVANGRKRGIALNSGATVIENSYLSDFKLVGQDAQAIAGWNGPGPYTIFNNYIEGAGENLIFGGADPTILNLVPSDIMINGNTFMKPLTWRGQSWQVKNLLELKNAQRVTITGNTFANVWSDAQVGFAVQFTVRNQDGTCRWCVIKDLIFSHNIITHAAGGINILSTDDSKPSRIASNFNITNNNFSDIDPIAWNNPITGTPGVGRLLQILGGGSNYEIGHNTLIGSNLGTLLTLGGTGIVNLLNIHDNVFSEGQYGIIGDNTGQGRLAFNVFSPEAIFTNNAIIQGVPGTNINYGPQINFVLPLGTPPVGLLNPTTDGKPVGFGG